MLTDTTEYVRPPDSYVVMGYDKDNDHYDDLRGPFTTFPAAEHHLNLIVQEHHVTELRTEKGEPYDWFEIRNMNDPDTCLCVMS